MTLQDEARVRLSDELATQASLRRMRKAILDGDWGEAERLCSASKTPLRAQPAFLYALHKQQFLELVERQESQKAFTLLTKRLKPLEAFSSYADELKDLCYLLTCKSVRDVPAFRHWDGERGSSRERLVEQFASLLDQPDASPASSSSSVGSAPAGHLPDGRLLTLLAQAAAYQLDAARCPPKLAPTLPSLLEDFQPFVLPNALRTTLAGHAGAVKCVEFVGEDGAVLASGGADNAVRLWWLGAGPERCVATLAGHSSRVWGLASSRSGRELVSAGADGAVCVWELERSPDAASVAGRLRARLPAAHDGDVYAVALHPAGSHLASGGYDRLVRLWDLRSLQCVRTLAGHAGAVTAVQFNAHGNLLVSGSKDATVRFWDLASGVCVRSLAAHLGELSALQLDASGTRLLTACKDNNNRLWDLHLGKPLKRYRGHQNTSKNFVRARFGPQLRTVVGGSEDGHIYVWDLESQELLQRLPAHQGPAYAVAWNTRRALLASCGHDSLVRVWHHEPEPS